ncbi:MAG: dTDP-glucose 4,6-dehydratase [Gammaproteobacteria bacterium]
MYKRNVLVTGGAGFIGCNFVNFYLEKNESDAVVVLDNLTYAGNKANLNAVSDNANFRFEYGDIRDQQRVERLLRENEINVIVHFAAESHVDRSISGPDVFIETNIVGTHALLKAARQVWIEEGLFPTAHRFHHVSTDEVYGSLGPEDPSFTEETAYAPNSPYSASKAASDHLVRAYHRTYGLCTTVSNCSNNYGPYQHDEKLIPTVVRQALRGQAIPIYGTGSNVRDWLYVMDHCRAIDAILDRGMVGEVYNVGGGMECDNVTLAKHVCARVDELIADSPELQSRYPKCLVNRGLQSESLIEFVPDRAGHDFRYSINSEKIHKTLSFSPEASFAESLRQTVLFLLQRG